MKHWIAWMVVAAGAFSADGVRDACAVSELNFAQEMRERVLPTFEKGVADSFAGIDNISIHYRKWELPSERGAIVLLAGRGDPIEFYAETIHDFIEAGYSVYAMDHRGQGASGRMLPDHQKGYVEAWGDYAKDLEKFVATIVNARSHEKRFIVAHSMGGAIAADYLTKHRDTFNAAALITPMLRIKTGKYSFLEAQVIARALITAGKAKDWAPNHGPFDASDGFKPDNALTTNETRWNEMLRVFTAKPELQIGGATVRWVQEAIDGGHKIQLLNSRVKTPVLLLTAGQEEIVTNEAQDAFCRRASHCVQASVYPDSRHMILMEKDEIREDALARILGFFLLF